MKIFFEEHSYHKDVVKPYLHDHYLMYLKNDLVQIPYVGYYYSKEANDSVFVLPKVFINIVGKEEKAFGSFNPDEIVDTSKTDNPLLKSHYYNEVFYLSTWIYRAIARYKERHSPENITENVDVLNVQSIKGDQSETWIDIILRLIRFNNEHRNLFTYIARINSQGHNKINWQKTISRITPTLQDDYPVYAQFLNKSKTMNFDEELLVLFYSVLDYLHDEYNFKIIRNVNYQTDPREVQRLIGSGKGTRLLRSIRRKYFKDELVELWQLLNVFFQKAENVSSKRTHEEALMVKDFNRVFEDMIDALISDDTKEKHEKLKDQPDGKIVDHIYRYDSLMRADDIYYIGDSKYYKEGHDPGENSIFKQFTYAKNVIQMNMDIFHPKADDLGRPHYFDELTEGYNISPNFFIRGVVNPNHINYTEDELEAERTDHGDVKVERRQHHINRLFDRDTLFIQKYNINFLYVLSAYATNSTDNSYRKHLHEKFRNNLISWLESHYEFLAIRPQKGDIKDMLDKHFRTLLGKVFSGSDGTLILGMQVKPIYKGESEEKLQSDLYDVYHAIKDDFEVREYDLSESSIGEVYVGPKLHRIDSNMEVLDFFVSYVRHYPDYSNVQLWTLLVKRFGAKYWGMTEQEWLNLIDRYRFDTAYREEIQMVAEDRIQHGFFFFFFENDHDSQTE